jgi:hypothetical protein
VDFCYFFYLNINFNYRSFDMTGLRLSKTQGASGYNGKVQSFVALAANAEQMAIGDAVTVSGTGDATTGMAAIGRATGATNSEITGVIQGFEPDYSDLELKGRTASTLRTCHVQVDPNALYELEIGSVLAETDIGANFLLTNTAPTTSGNLVVSAMVSGVADATGPIRLIGLVQPTDGTALGAVGNIGIFSIIRSQQTNLTGV